MAYRTLYFRRDDGTRVNRYFVFDTAAELLTETLIVGDLAYTVDTGAFYVADSSTTWDLIASASGAPTTSTYLTLSNDASLSNERVLTAGTNISFSDSGANGTLTVNVSNVAPIDASYIVASSNGTLDSERVITAGSNISLTDGGANSTMTVKATPSGSDTQVQINDGGTTFGADAGLTYNKTSDLLTLKGTVDGNYPGIEIINTQTNAGGSVNETSQLSFGFGAIQDVAKISAYKIADYTSSFAEDSGLKFHVDQNGTLIEALRMSETGLMILGSTESRSALDVEGNVSIGTSYAGTTAAPSNGMIVEGQVGIGTSGTPGILGELTVADANGQAAIYIRGDADNSSPAQLFLTSDTSLDQVSIALIGSASTPADDSRPAEKGMQFNINNTEYDSRFEFDAEDGDSGSTVSKEIGMVVFRRKKHHITSGATITDWREYQFWAPQINGVAGGGAETITNGSTVYISDAPSGSNITLTNGPYALFVDAGLCRFDGNGTNVFELPADATDPTSGGGAATGRIPVLIGGATRYLAYY